jgi:hypothetical protein
MPKVALADTREDWTQLLQTAAPYENVKDLKVYLAELQAALTRLGELESLREHLQAQRQQATQELNDVRETGKDIAIQIRSTLRGILGRDNPLLTQFNMRPHRKRRRKRAPKPASDNSAPSE